jgi:hypothetical protein
MRILLPLSANPGVRGNLLNAVGQTTIATLVQEEIHALEVALVVNTVIGNAWVTPAIVVLSTKIPTSHKQNVKAAVSIGT